MRIYLDSGIFIAFINGNEEFSPQCRSIIESSQKGENEAMTSFVTHCEVVKMRVTGLRRLQNEEQAVTDLLDGGFLVPIALEIGVATLSRYIVWDFSIQVRDAIHLASACFARCERFYTTDRRLLSHSAAKSTRVTLPDVRLPEFLTQPRLPI